MNALKTKLRLWIPFKPSTFCPSQSNLRRSKKSNLATLISFNPPFVHEEGLSGYSADRQLYLAVPLTAGLRETTA